MPEPDQLPSDDSGADEVPDELVDDEAGRAIDRLHNAALLCAVGSVGIAAAFAESQGVPVLETVGAVLRTLGEGANGVSN